MAAPKRTKYCLASGSRAFTVGSSCLASQAVDHRRAAEMGRQQAVLVAPDSAGLVFDQASTTSARPKTCHHVDPLLSFVLSVGHIFLNKM